MAVFKWVARPLGPRDVAELRARGALSGIPASRLHASRADLSFGQFDEPGRLPGDPSGITISTSTNSPPLADAAPNAIIMLASS